MQWKVVVVVVVVVVECMVAPGEVALNHIMAVWRPGLNCQKMRIFSDLCTIDPDS